MSLLKYPLSFNFLCLALLITVQCNTIDGDSSQQEALLSNLCGTWQNNTVINDGYVCSIQEAAIVPTYSNGTISFDTLRLLTEYQVTIFLTLSTQAQGMTWTGNFTTPLGQSIAVSVGWSDDQATFNATSSGSCSLTFTGNSPLISGTWVRDSNIISTMPETYEIEVINNTYLMSTYMNTTTDSTVTSYVSSQPGNIFDARLQMSFGYNPYKQMLSTQPSVSETIVYYPQNQSTNHLIFPLGTWGNSVISQLGCCIPNSIEISADNQPATTQELTITYQFTSNAAASQACADIYGSMVNDALETTLNATGTMSWEDVLGAFQINLGDDIRDDSATDTDSSASDSDDGKVITGAYGSFWSGNIGYQCQFNMTLQEGPSQNDSKSANWKSIKIIYGIFILFMIFN